MHSGHVDEYGSMDDMQPGAAELEYMMPGPVHEELAKSVGDWSVEGRFWMAPGGEPVTTEGTAHNELILGGRYVLQSYEGSFMGQPFQGMMIGGYNNGTHDHFSFWIDSMGTGYTLSAGREAASGEVVMKGIMQSPQDPHGSPYRSVVEHASENEMSIAMFAPGPDGGEFRFAELNYTR